MNEAEQYLRDERAAIMLDSGIPEWIIQQVVEEEARGRIEDTGHHEQATE